MLLVDFFCDSLLSKLYIKHNTLLPMKNKTSWFVRYMRYHKSLDYHFYGTAILDGKCYNGEDRFNIEDKQKVTR
jgi:hypothetical protein